MRRGSRRIEHLGSAYDDGEVEALTAAARQRLAEGQGALDLGLNTAGADGRAAGDRRLEGQPPLGRVAPGLPGARFRYRHRRGRGAAWSGVGAIIEPTSKADSLRVLSEAGVEPVDYRTVTRRLP